MMLPEAMARMADAVLFFALALALALGWFLSGRLDRGLRRCVPPQAGERPSGAEVALYVKPGEGAALAEGLERGGMSVECHREAGSRPGPGCRLACVLMGDDLENLLVSSVLARDRPALTVFSVCGDPLYRRLYAKAGVRCLQETDIDPVRLAESLRRPQGRPSLDLPA